MWDRALQLPFCIPFAISMLIECQLPMDFFLEQTCKFGWQIQAVTTACSLPEHKFDRSKNIDRFSLLSMSSFFSKTWKHVDKDVWGVFFQISNRRHPTEGGIYEALLYNVQFVHAACKELVTVFLDFKFYKKQLRSSFHQVRYAFKWDFDMRLNLNRYDMNLEMFLLFFHQTDCTSSPSEPVSRVLFSCIISLYPIIYTIYILHQGFGAKHISATGAVTAMFATAALRDIYFGWMRCHLAKSRMLIGAQEWRSDRSKMIFQSLVTYCVESILWMTRWQRRQVNIYMYIKIMCLSNLHRFSKHFPLNAPWA